MKPWEEGGLGMKEVLDFIGVPYENDPEKENLENSEKNNIKN